MRALIKIMVVISLMFSGLIFLSYTDYSKLSQQNFLIGATYMELDKSFFQVINNEISKAVQAKGDTIITLDGCLDSERQKEEIYYLINQNIDLLIVNPVDASKIEPALQAAKEANIPIVLVDSTISDPELYDCLVISNNYNAGNSCAKYLTTTLEQANILILEHQQVIAATQRIEGFRDYLAGNDRYRISGALDCLGQTDRAYELTSGYLQKNRNIDVIMALNDTAALGALAAVEQQGLNIQVYGVDGSPEIKKLLVSNPNIMATASQSPQQLGQQAIAKGYKLIYNEPVVKDIYLDTELITKENVAQNNIMGWQ